MATELGRRIGALRANDVRHPALRRLIGQMHGQANFEGGFNDRNTIHSDVTNRRSGAHTDLASEHIPCPEYREHHSDTVRGSEGDGWISSHSDFRNECDSHTDSGHSDYYSDMCR